MGCIQTLSVADNITDEIIDFFSFLNNENFSLYGFDVDSIKTDAYPKSKYAADISETIRKSISGTMSKVHNTFDETFFQTYIVRKLVSLILPCQFVPPKYEDHLGRALEQCNYFKSTEFRTANSAKIEKFKTEFFKVNDVSISQNTQDSNLVKKLKISLSLTILGLVRKYQAEIKYFALEASHVIAELKKTKK